MADFFFLALFILRYFVEHTYSSFKFHSLSHSQQHLRDVGISHGSRVTFLEQSGFVSSCRLWECEVEKERLEVILESLIRYCRWPILHQLLLRLSLIKLQNSNCIRLFT